MGEIDENTSVKMFIEYIVEKDMQSILMHQHKQLISKLQDNKICTVGLLRDCSDTYLQGIFGISKTLLQRIKLNYLKIDQKKRDAKKVELPLKDLEGEEEKSLNIDTARSKNPIKFNEFTMTEQQKAFKRLSEIIETQPKGQNIYSALIKQWQRLGPINVENDLVSQIYKIEILRDLELRIDGMKGIYTGQVESKSPHGTGRFITQYGRVFEGKFKDGMMNGYMRAIWQNGDYRIGEVKNNGWQRYKDFRYQGTLEFKYQKNPPKRNH